MRSLRALLRHDLAGPLVRYGFAGGCVALVYLVIPLLLHDVAGLSLEASIPIALVLAYTVHFNLQRHFVFAHVERFALSTREQIGRYAVIAAVQYPTTALATAFLPRLIGVSADLAFVIMTLSISLTAFLLFRHHVFHPRGREEAAVEEAAVEETAPRPADPV